MEMGCGCSGCAGADGKLRVMAVTPGFRGRGEGRCRRQVVTSNGMFTLHLWQRWHSKGLYALAISIL